MSPKTLLAAIVSPLTQMPVLLVLLLFAALVSIGLAGGAIGIVVLLLCLPPIFRYQMLIVEAHASGREPGALDADYFNWVGGLYSFFPLLAAVAFSVAGYIAMDRFGSSGAIAAVLLASVLYPSILALLAITHSPLQSVNPVALMRLFAKAGHVFWIAPAYFLLTGYLALQAEKLPFAVANFVQLFMMFSLAALVGALIEPYRLIDDIDIPEPVAPLRNKGANDRDNLRTLTLSHAYGFISRGNREGGFRHIVEEIARDPEPTAAWRWYFERMLTWSDPQHALFFAQHCIRDMLVHGETVPALKMILRCRLLNEQFIPFREDLPAAIAAAEQHGNDELAAVLKRM